MSHIWARPRIVVLMDNSVPVWPFVAEWGLSLAIFTENGGFWLRDIGASDLVFQNADSLGLDITKAKGFSLSHGHWDHANALPQLLKRGFKGKVYTHPSYSKPRYAIRPNKAPNFIGVDPQIPPLIREMEVEVHQSIELENGLIMICDIPRRPGFFQPGISQKEHVFFDDKQGKTPDFVPDDNFLLMSTPKGFVVILGCCHSGLANSLSHLKDLTGISKIHSIVGGTHLFAGDKSAYKEAVDVLREFDIDLVYPMHCTGMEAWAFLYNHLPGKVKAVGSGSVISFA